MMTFSLKRRIFHSIKIWINNVAILWLCDDNLRERKQEQEKKGPENLCLWYNGILLPKLFWPTVRRNCSSDQEKLVKFQAEGREFEVFFRSLEQFIQIVKGQNNFW